MLAENEGMEKKRQSKPKKSENTVAIIIPPSVKRRFMIPRIEMTVVKTEVTVAFFCLA